MIDLGLSYLKAMKDEIELDCEFKESRNDTVFGE